MRKLMLGAAGLVGVMSVAGMASAQERDFLVDSGKRPVYASQMRKQEARTAPTPVERGRFMQQGKAIVWVPAGQPAPLTRQNVYIADSAAGQSTGRFVRQGKATIWVPNDGNGAQVAQDKKQ